MILNFYFKQQREINCMASRSRPLIQQLWQLAILFVLVMHYQVDAHKLDVSRMSNSDIEAELQVSYDKKTALLFTTRQNFAE